MNAKDSKLGKGYSYLMALLLTIAMGLSTIDYKLDCSEKCNYSLGKRDLPTPVSLFFLATIFGLLRLPTDKVADTIADNLSKGIDINKK